MEIGTQNKLPESITLTKHSKDIKAFLNHKQTNQVFLVLPNNTEKKIYILLICRKCVGFCLIYVICSFKCYYITL